MIQDSKKSGHSYFSLLISRWIHQQIPSPCVLEVKFRINHFHKIFQKLGSKNLPDFIKFQKLYWKTTPELVPIVIRVLQNSCNRVGYLTAGTQSECKTYLLILILLVTSKVMKKKSNLESLNLGDSYIILFNILSVRVFKPIFTGGACKYFCRSGAAIAIVVLRMSKKYYLKLAVSLRAKFFVCS